MVVESSDEVTVEIIRWPSNEMRICVHIIFHAETVKFIHPDKQAS